MFKVASVFLYLCHYIREVTHSHTIHRQIQRNLIQIRSISTVNLQLRGTNVLKCKHVITKQPTFDSSVQQNKRCLCLAKNSTHVFGLSLGALMMTSVFLMRLLEVSNRRVLLIVLNTFCLLPGFFQEVVKLLG